MIPLDVSRTAKLRGFCARTFPRSITILNSERLGLNPIFEKAAEKTKFRRMPRERKIVGAQAAMLRHQPVMRSHLFCPVDCYFMPYT